MHIYASIIGIFTAYFMHFCYTDIFHAYSQYMDSRSACARFLSSWASDTTTGRAFVVVVIWLFLGWGKPEKQLFV